ncbi:ferric reductase like transmembrane component-domain-containing protein [Bisporella sp. PMI_857]|nr:ferric reductase like transmembrane component-domain-containing protein [Bisporella sp. PMI_857]
MRVSTTFTLLCVSLPWCFALIGYGIPMYDPSCAFACRAAIASAPLTCSDHGAGGHSSGGHGASMTTTPQCRASNLPFLTTLAWCIQTNCGPLNIELWRLEKYWREQVPGAKGVIPKWSYTESVQQISGTPSQLLNKKEVMNVTVLVPTTSWQSQKNTLEHFAGQEMLHSRYGIVLLVTGFAIPIVFTALGYLPYMTGVFDKIKPYVVYPAVIGRYHVRPLPYFLGNAPLLGESLYVAFFFALNVILTAVNYHSTQPNTWFTSTWQEIMAYSSARTGVLAFALAPLVILFSGRNNILLWLTNWSHSTFMLLHRWVARIFGLQIILHSILELILYKDIGTLSAEQKEEYWIWGIVATLAVCISLVISPLYFRRKSYEIFLILHIILAVFVLVGSWYHVELLFTRKWGYEFWIYAACAVWFADRLLRALRIAKTGRRHATITDVASDIVRVDIEGVRWAARPGYHAYAYFPTLNKFRPWENHPFSVIPTSLLHLHKHNSQSDKSSQTSKSADRDIEKSADVHTAAEVINTRQPWSTAGVSLYIRKSNGKGGITKFLKGQQGLTTLLDGPYPNNPTKAVLGCDRLLLIGGGIGITALIPFLSSHTNVHLCWSLKQSSEGIIHDLSSVLEGVVEKQILVGKRLDVEQIIIQEANAGWKKIGVVVCGPGGLCDDVRAVVTAAGRQGKAMFELEVDAFSW